MLTVYICACIDTRHCWNTTVTKTGIFVLMCNDTETQQVHTQVYLCRHGETVWVQTDMLMLPECCRGVFEKTV